MLWKEPQRFPPSGATAAYDFESGSGNTLVERTGNDADGMIYGMSWTAKTQYGDFAGSFDGTDDYVRLSNVFRNGSTYEAKFKIYPRSIGQSMVFLQKNSWGVFFDRERNQTLNAALYGDSFSHGKSLTLNSWYNVYVRWDKSSQIVIEIDGDRRSTSTSQAGNSGKDTFLGKRNTEDYIDCRLDNVAFAFGDSARLDG